MPSPKQPLPPSAVSSARLVSFHWVSTILQSLTVSRLSASAASSERCFMHSDRCSFMSFVCTESGKLAGLDG